MLRHHSLIATVLGSLVLVVAPGCGRPAEVAAAQEALDPGPCPMGNETLTHELLTEASIPSLSELDRQQIIAAVHQSTHTDVVTIGEAFDAVDAGEIDRWVTRDSSTNQFYVHIEYGAGDNPYGAYLYWGTAQVAAAIHDGFPENCGPAVFNYDLGDTAPECHGFLDYANTATYAQLDAYLPSNVALNVVSARTSQPFSSIASVVAVNGVAEARLQQMLTAARTGGFVGTSCSGIYDQVAVSTTEASAMVDLANQASSEELHGVLSFLINQTVVNTLTTSRPYANVGGVSNTSGVGNAVFRALRNAATYYRPFEQMVSVVNATNHPDARVRMHQHFDWRSIVASAASDPVTSMVCFGINPTLLPPGATNRALLANSNEVLENVDDAFGLANAFGEITLDPTPGFTDREARDTGHSFFGCYINYHPDPWTYDSKDFYVDQTTGASLLIDRHYAE